MIPKIIHYCWFGKAPLSDKVKKCIASWKKYLPDYEIKEWSEDNFNINSNFYTRKMYENKEWAFVSDYVRLYALINYGGIYFDTDVEVLKNMDSLLDCAAFCGFQESEELCTAVLACEPDFDMFIEWMNEYKNIKMLNNEEPNVLMLTRICQKYGLKLNNQRQTINDLEIYPSVYFSPKDYRTNEIHITKDTYAIHHFSESWHTSLEKRMHQREAVLNKKYGQSKGHKLAIIFNLPLRLINAFKKRGLRGEILYFLFNIQRKNKR